LRSSNIDASAGSVEELQRIVAQIRCAWPQVRIVVRGDSGFCREELLAWCEAEGVDYLLGLAKKETRCAARLFQEFVYQTRKSWRNTCEFREELRITVGTESTHFGPPGGNRTNVVSACRTSLLVMRSLVHRPNACVPNHYRI
jgi:hypothetical protein